MRILKEETQALFIDFQSRLYPHISNHENLTKKTKILISGLQALEIPIIVSEQYVKGLGETIEEIKEALGENYQPLEKSAFSCCDDNNIVEVIEKNKKKSIILSGIESHICVLQTAIDLIEKGYTVIVVSDCVSSRSQDDKEIALERLRKEGAIVTSCESILFELCRFSGTPAFKAISKLIK